MVRSHQTLLLVAPLEQGEVDNPQTLEHVLVAQTQAVTHLQTQSAKLGARLVGLVARKNQYEVAIFGTGLLFQILPDLRLIELIDRRLHRAVVIELDIYQTFGTHLGTLHKVGQLVELLAGIFCAARYHNTTDVFSFIEYREFTSTFQHIHQFDELHTEAQVGLIATEATHSLMPRHTLQLRQLDATNLLEQMTGQILEDVEHILLIGKRHLTVNLRELRLAVGTQVLVTETLGNLEVTVETANHQQLLQCLRTLGQCIELTRIHTTRHHKVASALRRRTNQNRRLHLDEIQIIEEVTNQNSHLMAQLQILSNTGTAQVEVAILHTNIVTTIGIVFNGEGRRLTLAQHIQLRNQNLDITRIHLGILGLTFTDNTCSLDAPLTSQLISLFT